MTGGKGEHRPPTRDGSVTEPLPTVRRVALDRTLRDSYRNVIVFVALDNATTYRYFTTTEVLREAEDRGLPIRVAEMDLALHAAARDNVIRAGATPDTWLPVIRAPRR